MSATQMREKMKKTTKQKATGWQNKGRGNHLEQDSVFQTKMEGIDGGLHPAVDGQHLSEVKWRSAWNVWLVDECNDRPVPNCMRVDACIADHP